MKLFITIISCLLLLGCQEYEFADMEERSRTACGKKAEDMPWLQEMIDAYYDKPDGPHCRLWSVEQGVYRGQTVFMVNVGGALCCTCAGASVLDCQGEVVFVCESDKEKKIRKRQLIWERK